MMGPLAKSGGFFLIKTNRRLLERRVKILKKIFACRGKAKEIYECFAIK
jgi:hypothetical protein